MHFARVVRGQPDPILPVWSLSALSWSSSRYLATAFWFPEARRAPETFKSVGTRRLHPLPTFLFLDLFFVSTESDPERWRSNVTCTFLSRPSCVISLDLTYKPILVVGVFNWMVCLVKHITKANRDHFIVTYSDQVFDLDEESQQRYGARDSIGDYQKHHKILINRFSNYDRKEICRKSYIFWGGRYQNVVSLVCFQDNPLNRKLYSPLPLS